MTGKWSQPGFPHKGWTCVGVDDLGREDRATCEMCESAEIRYVHYLEHPDHPNQLACGCVCAEHMTEDRVGPRQRERELRNRAHWVERRGWKRSARGHPYINDGACNVTLFRRGDQWSFRITDRRDMGITQLSDRPFADPKDAALAAFDELPAVKRRIAKAQEAEEALWEEERRASEEAGWAALGLGRE